MRKNEQPCYYPEYLQLDKLLDAQHPVSASYGKEAHDETLFIIIHQAYELWFKQILHELKAIFSIMEQQRIPEKDLSYVVHHLKRITTIQEVLNQQISIIETMTPQDFMSFRDYLVPASGFQSIQFKRIEIKLGLKSEYRVEADKKAFYSRLSKEHQEELQVLEQKQNLFDLVEQWLARMPLLKQGAFSFWKYYLSAANNMLDSDQAIIQQLSGLTAQEQQDQLQQITHTREHIAAFVDQDKFLQLKQQGEFRLSQPALHSALFIYLYRQEPLFQLPYQLLHCLTEIDEKLTVWRYTHSLMVQRILGNKIGTGGSSGHRYLKSTTENNRIFTDLFNMVSFMLPSTSLPPLPKDIQTALSFSLEQPA